MKKSMFGIAIGSALVVGVIVTNSAEAHNRSAKATLTTAAGKSIGTVKFSNEGRHTEVRVTLRTGENVAVDAFHGFHIHANTDGAGCVADASQPSSTWFTSAGGHWKLDGQTHSNHLGDMPSVYVNADGSTETRFTIDRIALDQLAGKAVMLHAGPDNFGNVPVGAALDQYTANTPDAVTKTQNTGNAGDRIACGVVSVK